MENTRLFRTLKALTEEIRSTIRELDEAASRSQVFIESDSESFGAPQINVNPRKIAFNRERAAFEKLLDLYDERARYEE